MIERECNSGDWSLGTLSVEGTEVDGPTIAKLLDKQGSDPEFFGLDMDGNDLEEEE